jgi:hypothetical protein
MLAASRLEAVAKGSTHYFTGKPCSRGHVAPRFVSNFNCVQCGKAHSSKWASKNPKKRAQMMARWVDRNPAYGEAWRNANRHRLNLHESRRRAARFRAEPPWLTQPQLAEIDGIYHFASVMTLLTGKKFHVDHEVPLQGKSARGLHVPWNLRAIEARENISKGNRVIPMSQAR